MLQSFKFLGIKPAQSPRVGDCMLMRFEILITEKMKAEDLFSRLCSEFIPFNTGDLYFVDDFGVSHGVMWVKVVSRLSGRYVKEFGNAKAIEQA